MTGRSAAAAAARRVATRPRSGLHRARAPRQRPARRSELSGQGDPDEGLPLYPELPPRSLAGGRPAAVRRRRTVRRHRRRAIEVAAAGSRRRSARSRRSSSWPRRNGRPRSSTTCGAIRDQVKNVAGQPRAPRGAAAPARTIWIAGCATPAIRARRRTTIAGTGSRTTGSRRSRAAIARPHPGDNRDRAASRVSSRPFPPRWTKTDASTRLPSIGSWISSWRPACPGICIAGATGEYPHFETAERERRSAGRRSGCLADRALLVGIGAPSMRQRIELGEAAHEPAAARCCCRCRCSSATSSRISRRSAPASAARCARPASSTTSRPSPTASSRTTMLDLLRTKRSSSASRTAAARRQSGDVRAGARGSAVVAAGWRRPAAARGARRPDGTAASPASRASVRSCWWRSTQRVARQVARRRRASRAARRATVAHGAVPDALGHPHRPGGTRLSDGTSPPAV